MNEPARVLVTGCAGFIGSTLVDRLLADGHPVVGVDCLTPTYDPETKIRNLEGALGHPGFSFRRDDLAMLDLEPLLDGVDAVVHLAGQPGVQTSWGTGFADHLERNVMATQRLLEAVLASGTRRVLMASSSSVYGTVDGATSEDDPVRPLSPYGVSKLSTEHLAALYGVRGLDVVPLRFFTAYGPRQRPDMAFHRMVEAALGGPAFPLRGDGSQRRSFTFVDDLVYAVVRLLDAPGVAGRILNVGSSTTTALVDVLALVGDLVGRPVPVTHHVRPPGDPDLTHACVERLREAVGWAPTTSLVSGLAAQVAFHQSLRSASGQGSWRAPVASGNVAS
ncbi:MAG: hypothetical protein CL466_03650 [Acidimicrobiaceae bacterium]|nr:hypothetical protein [Acidimicrobiaceae bacterium]